MSTLFQDVTNQVLNEQQDLRSSADQWGADTLARMADLSAAAASSLSALNGTSYAPEDSANLTYLGTPATVTEPDYGSEGPIPVDLSETPIVNAPDYSALGPDVPVITHPGNIDPPDYSTEGPDAPTLTDLNVVNAFDFTNSAYIGLVKSEMQSVIQDALNGTAIIPAAVYDAMYDRLVADIAAQYVQDTWAGAERGAALGWSLPSESTLAALAKADDDYSKQLSGARVAEFIKEWTLKHEDIWKGSEQGANFETMWINEHNATQDRLLRSALEDVNTAIEINKMLMQRDDQKIALYSAEWAALGQWIGAEVGMLNALVAEAGLGLRYDELNIDLYRSQWDSIAKQIGAETQRFLALIEDARTTIQYDDLQIRDYSEQWSAVSKKITAAASMFQARIQDARTPIASEQARHPFEATKVDKGLRTEDGQVNLAIEDARLTVENSLGTLSKLAELSANVAMALMAASDVSLGTSTSMPVQETHRYEEKCCE